MVDGREEREVATAPFDSAQGPEPVEGLCRRALPTDAPTERGGYTDKAIRNPQYGFVEVHGK
jgi:hypothetical protein